MSRPPLGNSRARPDLIAASEPSVRGGRLTRDALLRLCGLSLTGPYGANRFNRYWSNPGLRLCQAVSPENARDQQAVILINVLPEIVADGCR
jgi:hypothetical protein